MKLAGGLLPRFSNLAPQHAVPSLNLQRHGIRSTTAQRAYAGARSEQIEYKWGQDMLEEMRSGSRAAGRKLPKTWASTHGAKSRNDASTASTSTARRRGSKASAFQFQKTSAQLAKEAEQQELERGLEVYTHTSPAGPPLVAGCSFLNAFCKPSSSSQTLDQPLLPDGTTSQDGSARLRTPMLAYTANYDEAQDLLSCLGPGPMGLDLEWNFSARGSHRTALLQICSPSLILIIHLSAMSHRIPPLLKTILQDPAVIKTGVAIRNDALKLQRDYAIDTRNVVELSTLAKLAQPRRWAHTRYLISLRDLTRVYLGRRLRKDGVRVSDWERFPLDAHQIEYAASDTFASLEVLRAVSEYFRSGMPDGEQGGLLERLDRAHAGDGLAMELEQALKLSAYDLYHERVGLHNLDKQKREQRKALREIQPAVPAKPRTSPKASSTDSDDDFVTVTSVRLAHDRAMHAWLYANQTLNQVAHAANVKPSTIALYLIKALMQATEKRDAAQDGQRGLLDDFGPEARGRLQSELKQAGPTFFVQWRRYQGLARRLGWVDASGSGSGSEAEDGQRPEKGRRSAEGFAGVEGSSGKPALPKRTTGEKGVGMKALEENWSRPPIVVEISDDEVDVNETSRRM
ncbi:conserved hypothetical protein [Sporisorium reilianum SRZ2]|uniref:3'-5' exonuclease n=1 Tax=Sporisorium reilianum (strain SRZ2) TaxID=999809 RepID=E6ZSQ3_SPORE|nr:conserved hypothetical protein [Sporisorium reilianum SRZ2]